VSIGGIAASPRAGATRGSVNQVLTPEPHHARPGVGPWWADVVLALRAVLLPPMAALALILMAAGATGATEARSVLLLYADPRLAPATVTIDETLRATIEGRASSPVRFYTEYLDLSWFPGQQERHIGHSMRDKYANRTFDLVVPCGEYALRFALRERNVLFPGVPMVFCTVEDDVLSSLDLPADVTGVTTFRDWVAGLDLILRLHPGTRRIVLVGGAGPVERGWERLARKAFAGYKGHLEFTYVTGLPIDETVAAVAGLSEGSVIVFNVFLRDGAGRSFSSPEALARLAPAAKVPIYGYAETQVGHGIVGGPLVSYQTQAVRAGELALRVLRGERLGPADIEHRVPNHYTFDARQLARWDIRESLLSPGSVVRFQTPSLWREYRWYIFGVIVLAGAQTLLIGGLLIGRQRRRRVQRRLDERLRFEILLADLAAAFVEVPGDEIDERIGHGLSRAIRELGVDRAGLGEFNAAGDQLRVTHSRTRDGVSLPPGVFTSEAWPWTLGRVRRGESVCIARLAELPAEAASDRQSFVARGTKSIVMVPLVVAGVAVGGFACSMQRERNWPEELVQRLRLLADIFAVVMMRRRADTALAESEGRFQVLADAAPVPMWVAGPDGGRIAFNRAWLQFTGRAFSEQARDGWLERVHPDDRATYLASYQAALASRQAFAIEFRLERADGAYREMLDNGVPRVDVTETFRGYVGSAIDITDLRAAQRTRLESLALRSAIFGSLYGHVAAVDRAGVIIAVNESWPSFMEEMGGEARTAGVGANYLEICRRAASGGDANAQAALQAIEDVLAERSQRVPIEYPCATPAGVRWYAMIVEPLKRPEGGLVVSHIDITRRRRAEETAQRDREELAHALRVATLGELATSLAHEINQPLAAITTNAQAAGRLLQPARVDAEVSGALRDIADDAQRAAQIVRRLRVLFKKEPSEWRPVDVSVVIKEVTGLLHRYLERRQVRLEVVLPADPPRVLGDIVQLQQVVLNVLVNSVEAMADEASPRELQIDVVSREPGILATTVRDSGTGVESAELEHIFERFVTSKPEGLGLGLSISRSIVEAHGGRIWATRNTDRGLTMHIELPCLSE
jgi:PAS domain S-box-containing protein